MTPVSNNPFLRDCFPAIDLNDSPTNNGWISTVFYRNLSELKKYISEFELINQAIQQIPDSKAFYSLNMIEILEEFNRNLAGCSRIMDPLPVISCVREIEELEQKLNEHNQFLGELWAALPIIDKPVFTKITQIREWFNNKENQILLDTITNLNLEGCQCIRISKEFLKLSNLQFLRINANNKRTVLSFAFQFNNLREIEVVEKIIYTQNYLRAN